ncbi:MAG: hypothetical protein K2W88_13705 [Pararheinheimera sp.]|jgi:hypothetical protein|nr:hypothetical protein [Rheinheimera sp.]
MYIKPTENLKNDVEEFINNLLSQNISPPKGVDALNYKDNHKILTVKTEQNNYPANECWYNCVDYCLKNGGKPIFGWAIWHIEPNKFVAQHHAVVQLNDNLVDVTLGNKCESIIFVPDQNAPFDFDNLRFPFNFEQSPQGSLWFAHQHTKVSFSICRGEKLEHVEEIIKKGKAKGII